MKITRKKVSELTRMNLTLSKQVIKDARVKVKKEGHKSLSAVVEHLLRKWYEKK